MEKIKRFSKISKNVQDGFQGKKLVVGHEFG
jgi:hypothetical protein